MPEKLPFDKQITHDVRPFLDELLTRYPELRSVALICDFHEPLSRAPGLMRATWATENSIVKPDVTAGMLRVTVGFQEHLVALGQQIVAELERKTLEAGNRLLQQTQVPPTSPTATDGHGSPSLAETREASSDEQGKPPSEAGQG